MGRNLTFVKCTGSGEFVKSVGANVLLAVLCLLLLFAQTVAHARSASLTFDEGPHMAAGYTYLRTGDLRLQPIHIHPPLANLLAALPLFLQPDLPDPRQIDGWEIASLSAVTDAVVWQYPHPARLALAARLPIIGMTLLLGAVVCRWATDLWGKHGGLLALFLLALDPNIIAHGSLVTTDMAVTLWGTAALFLTARALRRPRRAHTAGAGILLGLALASKVSAVSLIPALLLLTLLAPVRLRHRIMAVLIGLLLAALTLWAIYRFEVRPIAGSPIPLPAATHLEIYRSLQEHYRLGHPAFLMGQNRDHGWWYYFPVAFALKTPLPTCLLTLATLTGRPALTTQALRRWAPLTVFPLVYLASTPFSSVNIGYRHLLPVLPFLFILVGRHGIRNTQYGIRGTYSVLRVACLAWLALGTLRVAPHYLAFFNELAGGPDGGYRYLVDSNLDWGQNLWDLRDWMRKNGVERVFYAHYNPARPEVYGISADWLPPDPRAVPFTPLEPVPGIYAIGATVLQGVYTPDVNTYAWFRSREPMARLGYALFLYRVEPRPAPRWAVLCTDGEPTLSPDVLSAGLGRSDLRIIPVACSQAWMFPAAGPPGLFVLPPQAEAPLGAVLDVAARQANGRPLYHLYRLETRPALPEAAPVPLNGPLTFLGAAAFSGTDTLTVETWWQVTEGPITRPLSIMGHLLNGAGELIGQADGLGVSPVVWQPGDIIVQRHRFQGQPQGGQAQGLPLQLRTGAYWLDTMERWKVLGSPETDEILIPVSTPAANPLP